MGGNVIMSLDLFEMHKVNQGPSRNGQCATHVVTQITQILWVLTNRQITSQDACSGWLHEDPEIRTGNQIPRSDTMGCFITCPLFL